MTGELAKSDDADLLELTDLTIAIISAFILPYSPSCKSSISMVQCITAPASLEDHGERDWCFSIDHCCKVLFNGYSNGLHTWYKGVRKMKSDHFAAVLLSHLMKQWYTEVEHWVPSNPGFTVIHRRQSQCRMYHFWPFPELYSVCGRYLQSLTESRMAEVERGG